MLLETCSRASEVSWAVATSRPLRPQRQQQKKREEILKNIRRGDQIVLGGGSVGKVTKVVDDNELEAEIADGVRVRVVP